MPFKNIKSLKNYEKSMIGNFVREMGNRKINSHMEMLQKRYQIQIFLWWFYQKDGYSGNKNCSSREIIQTKIRNFFFNLEYGILWNIT